MALAPWRFGLWTRWGWDRPGSLSADPTLALEEARGRPCLPGPEAWKHRFPPRGLGAGDSGMEASEQGPGRPGWAVQEGPPSVQKEVCVPAPRGPSRAAQLTGSGGGWWRAEKRCQGQPCVAGAAVEGAGLPPLQLAGDPTAIRQAGRLPVSPRGTTEAAAMLRLWSRCGQEPSAPQGRGGTPGRTQMALPPASTGTSPPDLGGSVLMGGPVLAGLEDSSSVPPGLHRVKDAPQTGELMGSPPS